MHKSVLMLCIENCLLFHNDQTFCNELIVHIGPLNLGLQCQRSKLIEKWLSAWQWANCTSFCGSVEVHLSLKKQFIVKKYKWSKVFHFQLTAFSGIFLQFRINAMYSHFGFIMNGVSRGWSSGFKTSRTFMIASHRVLRPDGS